MCVKDSRCAIGMRLNVIRLLTDGFMHFLDMRVVHVHVSTCSFRHIIRVLNYCGGNEIYIPQRREFGECNYEATNVIIIIMFMKD